MSFSDFLKKKVLDCFSEETANIDMQINQKQDPPDASEIVTGRKRFFNIIGDVW